MKSERFLCDPDISNNRSVVKPKYKNALKKVVMISKIHTFLSDRTFLRHLLAFSHRALCLGKLRSSDL